MANLDPVTDSVARAAHIRRLGQRSGLTEVFPVGAITMGLAGTRLAPIGEYNHSK